MDISANRLALSALITITTLISTTELHANSCSKKDVSFYLQNGFTHKQVLQLCTTSSAQAHNPTSATNPANNNKQQPIEIKQGSNSTTREVQHYLEASLKASNVKLTLSKLSYDTKECVNYGPDNNSDLDEDACVRSKISIDLQGLKVIKASKGLFMIKDVTLIVEGNIKREYKDINSVRRQEQEIVLKMLPTNPKQVHIPVKNGITPSHVVDKLKPFITP